MTANLIDEIEKYIPKSMALYDKELLLDNIKIILDEHKFTTPTSPVDDVCSACNGTGKMSYGYLVNPIRKNERDCPCCKDKKQTPVAKECKHEHEVYTDAKTGGQQCRMCGMKRKNRDDFIFLRNGYMDEQKERLKDSQPKEVEIKKSIDEGTDYGFGLDAEPKVGKCECSCICTPIMSYCWGCGSKIKWIA